MRFKMNNDDLYIIQSDVSGNIKIGRSKDPQKRLKQLQTGNPNKLKLIAEFKSDPNRFLKLKFKELNGLK